MSEARFNTLKDAAGANSMPVADINQGRAKAWWNFNGSGTIALYDSFNVSSLTDNGVGDYTATLTSPMANINYAAASIGWGGSILTAYSGGAPVAGALRVTAFLNGGAATDPTYARTALFGDS